jgi:hypothetical protein
MQIDPEALRQRYNSLSDEAFLAIDRSELIEAACYDAEFERRGLAAVQRQKQRTPATFWKPPESSTATSSTRNSRTSGERIWNPSPMRSLRR